MNQDFFQALQKMVSETWPGCVAFEVVIRLNTGRNNIDAVVPVFPVPTPAFKVSVLSSDAFVPSPVQNAIMKALDGKAMRSSELELIVGNKSQLYRKPTGGMSELREQGRIEYHEKLGYYRPDAPPKELKVDDEKTL